MPLASYAGLKDRFFHSDFSLSPTSGGSTTQATSFYYFVYGITRSGINLATVMGQVPVAIGEKLEFTINTSARPDGLQPFGFALGAATINDETQAKLLAVAWVMDSDQETDLSLPLTLELTTDEDFVIDGTVATFANLPSNPVNGAIRNVADESTFYQWDGDGFYGTPDWIQVYGTELYLSTTTTLRSGLKWKGGCNTPIRSIPLDPSPNFYGVISPPWDGEGSTSTPIKLWLLQGLTEAPGVVSPVDSQISLIALLNDDPELGSATLSGRIDLIINSFIFRDTGTVTVSIGQSATWASGTPFYLLENQLDPGYALEVEYTCRATIGNGDRITAYLNDDGIFGIPTNQIAIGSSAFVNQNKSLVIPDTLGVKRLTGKGLVVTGDQSIGYQWNCNTELGLTQGIVADTADQQIAISGIRNGAITCYQAGEPLLETEALRAIISTESGTATASDWTAPVTVGANGRIEVTIALPNAIRSDYPDVLIAGNPEAVRTGAQIIVFARYLGVIYQFNGVIEEADNDQVIVIDDLSGAVVVGSLPSNPDPAFGFWESSNTDITPVATGVGSLVAGDYEIAFARDYPSPNLGITKISHDINDGCIPTLSLSLAEAIAFAEIFSKVQLDGIDQPQRQILNIISRLASITDDPANNRIDLDFSEVGRVVLRNGPWTVNDDSSNNFRVGDIIVDLSDNPIGFYIAQSVAVGAAQWVVLGGGGSGSGITPIADLATLKALTGVADNANYLLETNNSIYRYDSDSTATADDNTVIIPDDKVSPPLPGRFLKTGTYNADEITETTRKFATQAQLDAIASNTSTLANKSDVTHVHTANKGDLVTNDGTNQIALAVGSEGQYVTPDSNGDLEWVDLPISLNTKTQASYTQPALNATVSTQFGTTANFVDGQTYLAIEDGGTYLVTNVASATTSTIQYLGNGANPTVVIATDRAVAIVGKPGSDGASSITTVLNPFTVPAVGLSVVIDVVSSAGINLDAFTNIATAGNYKITSKDDVSSPNTITAENLGGDNAPAGGTISAGSQIIISGSPGPTGAVSSTSSLVFDGSIPPPSTTGTERKVFPDSTNSNKLSFRDINDGTVSVFAFLSDILPTQLTGFVESTATAIVATDNLLEAFGKIQAYLSDFLTNFNGVSELIQLDGTGAIPKLNGDQITEKEIISVSIAVAQDGTYRILAYPDGINEDIRWDRIYDIQCDSNTGTISINIDATVITGFDTISVSSTGTNYIATANQTLSADSSLFLVITNTDNANPMSNLSFSLEGVKNP